MPSCIIISLFATGGKYMIFSFSSFVKFTGKNQQQHYKVLEEQISSINYGTSISFIRSPPHKKMGLAVRQ